jgi:RNase adapter protein RapZ
MSESPAEVVVVTGQSGAGRSTALRALEDLGYFCVDNLPTLLVQQAVESCEKGGISRVALGIDVRVGAFLDGATGALHALSASGHRLHVVFLDAADEVLLRRFSSTRRPHPLSAPGAAGHGRAANAVLDGIQMERERLAPLRALAGRVLDTTHLSVHELRRRIINQFGPGADKPIRMRTRLMSFGFKYGLPVDADLVLDVRFIENPFFIDDLRPLSGRDEAVRNFVMSRPDTAPFVERAEALLEFSLPRYEAEGKSYLTVAVGCTGGRHRSVVLSEHLAELLRAKTGQAIDVLHRDIGEAERELPSAGRELSSIESDPARVPPADPTVR